MFLEKTKGPHRSGWIEVICGSMFSGKTEELIRRLRRAIIARQTVEIFKPRIDVRYDPESIVSHDATSIRSTTVENASQIMFYAGEHEVVGIDEAQFFDNALPQVCNQLADAGKRVIVAGLDMDYLGKPFGPMPQLMAIADYVTKVHAICME
ncbi:MAG: thymidine kinase, partial [Bacteroidetes bacterium]|nr:thymidine kinase [Bacteroidota bacterium]